MPAIDGALVFVACDLRDVIAGGDHVIVTGAVTSLEAAGEGTPLVFHDGEYRPLGEDAMRSEVDEVLEARGAVRERQAGPLPTGPGQPARGPSS